MGAVNVGTLVAVLKADVSKWIPGMKNAEKSADKTSDKVDKLSAALSGLAAAAGGAAVALAMMDWSKQSAENENAAQIFEKTGGSIENLRKATQGMISDSELYKKSNMAAELQINSKQFEELSKVAVASSKVMGISQKEAFDRMILGTAKMEKEILEETGIVFKAEAAYKAYAKAHNLNYSTMDDAAKKQAFINQVIKQGQGLIGKAALSTSAAADGFARMTASIANAKDAIGKRLIPVMSKIGNIIADVIKYFENLSEPVKRVLTGFAEVAVVVSILLAVFGAIAGAIAGVAAAFAAWQAAAAFLGPIAAVLGQLIGTLMVVGFVVGLVASIWEKELVAISKDTDDTSIDIEEGFKSAFLAALATAYTLSAGLAKVMDFIAYNIIEAVSGIVMIFTLGIDLISGFWGEMANFALKSFSLLLQGAKSAFEKFPRLAKALGLEDGDIDNAIKKLDDMASKGGLDFSITNDVIKMKKDMQDATFKFSVNETPMELALQTWSAIGDLTERSGRGLKALLGAVIGDADDILKKFDDATKKTDKKKKGGGLGGLGGEGDMTVVHVMKGNSGGIDPFEILTNLTDSFGSGGISGVIGKGLDASAGLVGGGIAAALGIAGPGVGEAIGKGLLATAEQIGEVIAAVMEMTLVPLFETLIAPLFSAGNGEGTEAMDAGMQAFGAMLALGALTAILIPFIPVIVAFTIVMVAFSAVTILIVGGFLTLLAIILFIPTVILSVIAAFTGLTAFILDLATKSDSFKRFGDALDFATDILIAGVEPVFESFMPLAGIAIMVAEGFKQAFLALTSMDFMMRVVFEGLRIVGLALMGVAFLITAAFGGNVEAVTEAMHGLLTATYESAGAMAESAVATNDAADAARSLREELYNLSPGFNHRAASSAISGAVRPTNRSLANGATSRIGGRSSMRTI